MIDYLVETCADHPGDLKERLNTLAGAGTDIVSVMWQPTPATTDQADAMAGRGSFVIVGRRVFDDPLAKRPLPETMATEAELLPDA